MTGWLHSLKRWLRWLYWGVYLDQAMAKEHERFEKRLAAEHERFEKRLAAVENGDCQNLVAIPDLSVVIEDARKKDYYLTQGLAEREAASGAQAVEITALKQELNKLGNVVVVTLTELQAAFSRIDELEKAAKHPPAQRMSTPSFRAAVQRGAVEFRPPVGHGG